MSVTITNNDLPGLGAQLTALVTDAVSAAAYAVLYGTVERMDEGKSGRYYAHPEPHIAAAPGEAPAIVTGDLAASYAIAGEGLHQEVGSDSIIAVYQEFGTTRMPAHPALLPSVDDGVAAAQAVLDGGA